MKYTLNATSIFVNKEIRKGFIKKQETGEIPFFTGIDSPYEEPDAPELVLDSGQHDREACKTS